MFVLAIWMLYQAGFSSLSLQLSPPAASNVATVGVMANAAMLIVAYFAALLLNFGDFARFGKDEAAMKVGNFLGLPVNFLVFSIIAVIVTAGTLKVFGQAIMDPVLIVEKIGNPIVVIIGSITFIVATMGINIVANFVSPAYDISNLKPEKINFRMGGLITSILSVLVCPWLFVASPSAITLFVSIFGSVLGPMFGIMMADYYLVKKQVIVLDDLYTMSPSGTYNYDGGWNRKATDRAGDLGSSIDRPFVGGRLRIDVQCGRLGLADRRRHGRASLPRSLRPGAFARPHPRGRVDFTARLGSVFPRRRTTAFPTGWVRQTDAFLPRGQKAMARPTIATPANTSKSDACLSHVMAGMDKAMAAPRKQIRSDIMLIPARKVPTPSNNSSTRPAACTGKTC